MGDTFHHATIAQKDISMVINHYMPRAVELGSKNLLGKRHTDAVGDSLTEGTCCRLHAWSIAVLGMAGRSGVQLAKILKFADGQVITAQMQQSIVQHRTVPVGKNKSVAIGPRRVSRIVFQVVTPQYF